jgi:hypothetical protein
MERQGNTLTTVSGIVVAEDWDQNDNVVEVAIETSDGEEYLVEHNGRASELLGLIDQSIVVKGVVGERLDGLMTIDVKKFESLGQSDDDAEEDDLDDDYDDDDDDELDYDDDFDEDYDDDELDYDDDDDEFVEYEEEDYEDD